jgi:hypothetical protein
MRLCFVILLAATLAVAAGCEDRSPGSGAEDCANGVDDDGDGLTDCADPDCATADACLDRFDLTLYSADLPRRGVDLLVVMDNSGGTLGGQQNTRLAVSMLRGNLSQGPDGLPDLHVGVVTTDLGAGGQPIPNCEDADGDDGRLWTGNCVIPGGDAFLIDAWPRGCAITRNADGTCASHDCTDQHCAHAPTTTLVEEMNGCPRCKNTDDEVFWNAFECISYVYVSGCGFEQPLEAMYRALDDHPDNAGFLRDDAHLAVIVFTDEDDCSVRDPHFFDMSDTGLDSELGPLTSFRCFEFGVRCDVDDRHVTGLWPHCAPREADDPKALLYPIDRYVQFLRTLRPDDHSVVVFAQPPEPEGVRVGMDLSGVPELGLVCSGTPAVRLRAFIDALYDPVDRAWALSSSCSEPAPGHELAMQAMAQRILNALGDPCAPRPPRGCTDIAAAFGLPGDGQPCNDACVPRCTVEETTDPGTPAEASYPVDACLEVCPDGPCPGNTDATQAYAAGHPLPLDPALPVAQCWHFTHDEACTAARGAKLTLARRAAPPPRTVTRATCDAVPQAEQRCANGVDDDGDCLTDAADPDCQ